MAPMASSDSEVKTCSKTCLKNNETLKKQYDDLRTELNKSQSDLANYKRGLASVEERLLFFKKNEVVFCEKVVVLKRDVSIRDSEINVLRSELEKLKQEKESYQLKIENFENASKSLDQLLGSQIADNSRKGVGFVSYNVVPPPHTGLFSPPKIDLSNSGLEEFQEPKFEGYGPKTSKNVSEESPDAPLVEKLVSDDKSEKKTIFPTVAKIEFVKSKQQEKPVRKPVKYAEMYRQVNTARPKAVVNAVRTNRVNAVKESVCWVWRPIKPNSASITLKRYDYVDARGRSRSLKFVKKSPVNKVWRVKQVKQVWQATGKLFTNVEFQWQPTRYTMWKDLEEFQQPEFEGYEPKDSKNVSTGALIIEDWESDSDDEKKPKSKVEKKIGVSKTVSPTVSKIEFVRPKQQKNQLGNQPKAVVNAVRTNQVNVVKALACWVWRPIKPNSPSITLKRYDYVDARGRSSIKYEDFNSQQSSPKLDIHLVNHQVSLLKASPLIPNYLTLILDVHLMNLQVSG
ncbi:hypothetical protein Tco_0839540 [Tanacetum coccineum]|uniref:Uncharacterized protein n=1 Tax=Tanacetum coccineum TaxID=301880 RepID=A0ABQ5ARS5_9ASTR